MRYKRDWPEARERLKALWEGRRADRPCIAVTAPSGRNVPPAPSPPTAEQRWLSPDWILADARARMENTWWGGEAIPSYLLMAGWVVCLGGTPQFDAGTIWHRQMEFGFDAPPSFLFDPESPYVKRYGELYATFASAAGKDDFFLGAPCLLPASDLLSMLMGAESFLVNLVDRPEWMRQAILEGARSQTDARRYFNRLVQPRHEFWYGNAGWMSFWAPEPYNSSQSDVSCMLSAEMFETFVLPELDVYGREFGALWYHLDGGDARQHLPRLLSLPYLRVLQYTPNPSEPPNGPAHLDFYRQVQAAGKIVHIQLPRENVKPLVNALDPTLLMLDTWCGSIEEGESLLGALRFTATRQFP